MPNKMLIDDFGIEWRSLEQFPDILISENGIIKRANKTHHLHHIGELPQYISEKGYRYVSISRRVAVHRLVAMAFCIGYHPRLEVNHKDGNKANNHFSNLEWVSHSANMQHAWAKGLIKPKSPCYLRVDEDDLFFDEERHEDINDYYA